jgi:hypothetical protein
MADQDRFYCPYPGCKRSFSELWRLKVHFRAAPDIRGSGKERGHGRELDVCPKCQLELKPGRHHIGCSTRRNKPPKKRKAETALSVKAGVLTPLTTGYTAPVPNKLPRKDLGMMKASVDNNNNNNNNNNNPRDQGIHPLPSLIPPPSLKPAVQAAGTSTLPMTTSFPSSTGGHFSTTVGYPIGSYSSAVPSSHGPSIYPPHMASTEEFRARFGDQNANIHYSSTPAYHPQFSHYHSAVYDQYLSHYQAYHHHLDTTGYQQATVAPVAPVPVAAAQLNQSWEKPSTVAGGSAAGGSSRATSPHSSGISTRDVLANGVVEHGACLNMGSTAQEVYDFVNRDGGSSRQNKIDAYSLEIPEMDLYDILGRYADPMSPSNNKPGPTNVVAESGSLYVDHHPTTTTTGTGTGGAPFGSNPPPLGRKDQEHGSCGDLFDLVKLPNPEDVSGQVNALADLYQLFPCE